MNQFPQVFPELYRTLVEAGESSGQLGPVLLRLADYTEDRQALRQKVGLAFIYPAIVVTFALAALSFLLTYVVPQVVQVFRQTNQALPWLTVAVISVSDFLRHYGIYLAIAVGVSAWAIHRALKAEPVRESGIACCCVCRWSGA
jgi:general secretion pathway protein F